MDKKQCGLQGSTQDEDGKRKVFKEGGGDCTSAFPTKMLFFHVSGGMARTTSLTAAAAGLIRAAVGVSSLSAVVS